MTTFDLTQVIRKGEVSCCWICTACKDNEYVQDEFTCKACELGWWPDRELEGTRRTFPDHPASIMPRSYVSFLLQLELQLHCSHFTLMSLAFGLLCFYLSALQFVLVCKHFFLELFHSSVLLQMRSHDTQELFITFTFHLPPAPPSSLLPTLKKSVLCCSKTLLLFHNHGNTKSSGDEKKYQLDIERAPSRGDLIWMHEKCDSLPC